MDPMSREWRRQPLYELDPELNDLIRMELRRQQEGRFGLLDGDDGEGFPPHLDPETSQSLGLKLVTSLGKQLGGAVTFETNGGALTRIDGMSSKAVS